MGGQLLARGEASRNYDVVSHVRFVLTLKRHGVQLLLQKLAVLFLKDLALPLSMTHPSQAIRMRDDKLKIWEQ